MVKLLDTFLLGNHQSRPSLTKTHEKELVLKDSAEVDQVRSAEALQMLKVAESDYSLTSCDNIGKLFMQMFLGNISNQFQLGQSKASYIVSDGFSPWILDKTMEDTKKCGAGYTPMFDKATINQDRKQLDVLIRYWSNEKKQTNSF